MIGTGGFVSGPAMLAAALGGRPTLVQEQNAVAGFTNRVREREDIPLWAKLVGWPLGLATFFAMMSALCHHVLALDWSMAAIAGGVLSALGVPTRAPTPTSTGNDPFALPGALDERRLGLAEWIADDKNPLTSRSIVNRIWQYHFGKAIAGNPNNFGASGKRPTHPDLLNWMAADFVENGWAVKIMANSEDSTVRGNNFVGNSFDVATNSRRSYSAFELNYWDRYRGYDRDGDGHGDVPFHPVRLCSLVVAQNEPALVLQRSPLIALLDIAEQVIPLLTPENLADPRPAVQPVATRWRTP